MQKYQTTQDFTAYIDGKFYKAVEGQIIRLEGIAATKLLREGRVRPYMEPKQVEDEPDTDDAATSADEEKEEVETE